MWLARLIIKVAKGCRQKTAGPLQMYLHDWAFGSIKRPSLGGVMVVYFFMYLISSLSASKIKKIVIKVIKSTSATPFHKGVANHPPGLPFATSTGYHNLSNIATWFAMGFWSYPDIDILHNPVYNKSSKRLPSKTAGPSLCVLLKSDFSNPTSNHHLAEWWLLTFLCIWSALWALQKSKK